MLTMSPSYNKKEAGRLGGLTTAQRHGTEYLREIGRRGGEATKAKMPESHYSDIGKVGLQARIDSRWNGDREAYFDWLARKGQFVQDPFPRNGAFEHPGGEPSPGGKSPNYMTLDDWDEEWARTYARYEVEQREREVGA